MSLGVLFCMKKCDVYGRPFLMNQPSWKAGKGVSGVYFDDMDGVKLLKEAHKGTRLRISPAKAAFNAALGVKPAK